MQEAGVSNGVLTVLSSIHPQGSGLKEERLKNHLFALSAVVPTHI